MLFLLKNKIDSSSCKNIYWKLDSHFNSKGYELLAQSTFELFENEKWIFLSEIDSSNNIKIEK